MNIELTREKFSELNAENFTRCIDTVKAVLKDAAVVTGERRSQGAR